MAYNNNFEEKLMMVMNSLKAIKYRPCNDPPKHPKFPSSALTRLSDKIDTSGIYKNPCEQTAGGV